MKNTTIKYSKKEFIEDVKREIIAIKKTASPLQIRRLDFETLRPSNYNQCIYGQMTGDCTNSKAKELIFSCCKRYFHQGGDSVLGKENNFSGLKKNVNGRKVPGAKSGAEIKRGFFNIEYYSALEAYIMLPDAKNKNVIDYLKGETKTLTL